MNTRSSSTAAKLPTANDIKLINDTHQAVVTSSQSGLDHAIECGEMLRTAKEKVGHGGWENWLADNCPDIAPRTASRYMRLAKKGDELEKAAEQNGHALADFSATAANRLLTKPKTEEEKAAAKAEKEKKQQTAQEQARAKWIKSLGPTGLCELLANLWETGELRELIEQINKRLSVAPSTPRRTVALPGVRLTLSRDQMRVLIEMFPYLRPKLSAVGHFGGKSFAEQLAAEERAIERSKQPVPMLNAPKTIEHEELVSSSDLKKPFQRNYRRFTSTR